MYTRKGIEGSNPSLSAKTNRICMENGEHFFVYILQSLKDFSFYVGQCDDLDRRMSKHFDGFSKYTATKRPWRLVYFEKLPTRSHALRRENEIKSKKSRQYIESLISNWRVVRVR